ncbi:hypothetical protein COU62_02305 [Candidatus Pacearchaeota archaeon CG10_big_fil_rev_8_21_14_0_10_35_219]|nr:hypothetical protein [Candidatus Pacearchaeota archaeon]OIO41974.1 MAG: hypothetical protein AUJ63_04445 [Candidatus Pacearchaeota archaeon CG1_02_35_32]PIO07801.1 MAG: hypothetical protein COU62_02305 [Candidatus Pacearchaeota archaeon CG10_big_fil_rev_8_21_14_0_10_35_219]PIY81023.1 MAG: hypothetical protein COY79_04415 [Candidatus Pacearchaeota archaeon CG_4_10_14_0_8_um_filter_35_169]PIZ79892.1 MAG: hypothetical protein COY00_02720 [Candidatus Pacearchaeota archaeon CG_4_10_14_0_2_um_filt
MQKLTISEGWNLVPSRTSLEECYYSDERELCKDDVLAEYYYIHELSDYITQEELKNNPEKYMKYIDDDENPAARFYSKWIYIDSGASDKWLTYKSSVTKREQYLEESQINLFEGWNFLTFQPFMVWDDDLEDDRLSFNEMKGTCEIENLYFWQPVEKEWIAWDLNEKIDNDLIGAGFVIKVSESCHLGYEKEQPGPPPTP